MTAPINKSHNNPSHPLYAQFDALNGIRAISILWVVLHHLPIPLPEWLNQTRIRGDLGVELFFAVSGFLVMRSLVQCRERNSNALNVARDFFARRLSRIFPPYYFTLAALAAMAMIQQGSLLDKLNSISDILWSFPLYLYNYARFWTEGQIPGTLNVMWSLAFEEQFYLILIAAFLLFRKRVVTSLWILAIGAIAWRLTLSIYAPETLDARKLQFYTHLRLDAIMWGCLAWVYYPKVRSLFGLNSTRSLISLVSILTSCLLVIAIHSIKKDPLSVSTIYLFTGIAFTGLITWLTFHPGHWISNALSCRPLNWIGIISYEIYLLHEIVVGLLVKAGIKQWPWGFMALAIIGSVGLASIMHIWINQPLQKRMRTWLQPA